MSELQISLLAIGFLVVVGVYGFNRWQERKYRKRVEQAFPARQEDVLLQDDDPAPVRMERQEAVKLREEPRIEPVVSVAVDEPEQADLPEPAVEAEALEEAPPEIDEVAPAVLEEPAPAEEAPAVAAAAAAEEVVHHGVAQLDEMINFVARIHPGEAVSADALFDAVQGYGNFGKTASWLGLNPNSGSWEEAGHGARVDYHEIAATLQLADRSGPVVEQELAVFCDAVQQVAQALLAVVDFPDRSAAMQRAAALDQFGAEVDVLIGVNIISQNGEAFAATKVRALAEAAGMKLRPDGAFHYSNDDGADLYALGNLDPAPFSTENIRHLSTHGITFLFDVPRVAEGTRAFNQMLTVARQMASSLGGVVVDDNRRPLSDSGIDRIKQQLGEIYARMETQQIKSGSARALRLFA